MGRAFSPGFSLGPQSWGVAPGWDEVGLWPARECHRVAGPLEWRRIVGPLEWRRIVGPLEWRRIAGLQEQRRNEHRMVGPQDYRAKGAPLSQPGATPQDSSSKTP